MKIEINLDETRFKDLVDSELSSFKKEEIHDILSKAVSQYVIDQDIVKNLFYTKKTDYYGRETEELVPTPLFEKAIQNVDTSKTIEKLKSDVEKLLLEDDIIKRLAENLFFRFISGRIDEMMWNSSTLSSLIQVRVNQTLDDRLKH